jgi:hypothetical protein
VEDSGLREPLDAAQKALLRVIYEPFASSGKWPIWQYVELTLDARGLEAAALLDSLPTVRDSASFGRNYSLVWYMNPGPAPGAEQQVALTVAGMHYLPEAAELIDTLLRTVEFLVEKQRQVKPDPAKVVEATVTSEQITEHLLSTRSGRISASVDITMNQLYEMFMHEPILYGGVQRPNPEAPSWQIRVPWVLRRLRGVSNVDEYIDCTIAFVAPAVVSSPVMPGYEPDLPTAIGYANAVWRNATGHALFSSFDPTSIVRLAQGCASEADFNSLLSALADALGQIVSPGGATPKQRGALEAFRQAAVPLFERDAGERVGQAIDQLIVIRRLRVSTQHADARYRAVSAFQELGLSFPPPSWNIAWTQVASLAEECLSTIREEALASLMMPEGTAGT